MSTLSKNRGSVCQKARGPVPLCFTKSCQGSWHRLHLLPHSLQVVEVPGWHSYGWQQEGALLLGDRAETSALDLDRGKRRIKGRGNALPGPSAAAQAALYLILTTEMAHNWYWADTNQKCWIRYRGKKSNPVTEENWIWKQFFLELEMLTYTEIWPYFLAKVDLIILALHCIYYVSKRVQLNLK